MSTREPDDASTDPYATQTQTNTGSQAWLSDYQTIKADFGSLSQYAMNMVNAAMDLQPAAMTLYKIPQLATDAFRGEHPFPEGQLAALFVGTNFKDFVAMLTDLHVGLQNTAYAAQTISDSYHLNDDGSSHDLNSLITADGVDFAFGMGGARPQGLDKHIGKTWLETDGASFNEAQANAGAVNDAANPSQMGGTVSVSYVGPPDHETKVTTISYADGSQIQIEETVAYNGQTWTTTSIVGANGKTQSSSRQITSTSGGTTTVVTQSPDGNGDYQDSAQQTTTTSTGVDGSKVTTTSSSTIHDGKSTPSGTVVKTVNPDGSTDTTTTTVTQNQDGTTTKQTNTEAVGYNDGDVSNQQGSNDPKADADKHYTTFTHTARM